MSTPNQAEQLRALRHFDGEPVAFWPALVEALSAQFAAQAGVLLLAQEAGFAIHGPWLGGGKRGGMSAPLRERLLAFAGRLVQADAPLLDESGEGVLLGAPFRLPEGQPKALLVLIQQQHGPTTQGFLDQFHWLADIPADYLANQSSAAAAEGLLNPYEIALALDEGQRFDQPAMALCNEVASRFRCDQVSLGWLEREQVRLRASSHVERFDPKMALVGELEGAMEEALDQGRELLLPPPVEGDAGVLRAHTALSERIGLPRVLSLPLWHSGEAVAVLTLLRREHPFSEQEVDQLRLTLDLVSRRLFELHRRSRWFGARWALGLRDALHDWRGPRRSLAKVGLVALVLLPLLLMAWQVPYRVEAPFILRTEQLAQGPAPFDGYVDEVLVRVGDAVEEGQPLLRLATDDLRLQESSALADLSRYRREAEKARAAHQLAETRIAEALAEQAQAQLAEVRWFLDHAEIRAPFAGVVVEGELERLLGAPVSRGDVLLKVAALDQLYLEIDLDERDAHWVEAQMPGEVAFIAAPEQSFAISVERIEPQAEAKPAGNVFRVRAEVAGAAAPWWRPGMSGVAKLEVGERSLGWIITHRTVEFLRLWLWW